jgi:hypothetical protein
MHNRERRIPEAGGVVDRDGPDRIAGVAPRWPAAGTDEVHHPASDACVACDDRHRPEARGIVLTVTGSGERAG